MEIRESGEDYLEQILILQSQSGYARSIDIAVALNFSKPSVSIAMKTLRERGYITMDAESHIRLTDSGRAIAERIYDRHQRLTAVLVSLGVGPDTQPGHCVGDGGGRNGPHIGYLPEWIIV